MSEQGPAVSYGFQVRALRLTSPPDGTTDGKQSLDLGIRLARLAAEAPTGTRVLIHTRAEGNRLRMSVWAELTEEPWESRSGLERPELAVRDLAEQLAGFMAEHAEISEVEPFSSDLPGPAAPVLPLRPRVKSAQVAEMGFLSGAAQPEAVWAYPLPADPHAFARLLLAFPHVSLLQTVEPLPVDEVRRARADLADDLIATDPAQVSQLVGSPVRASAMLVAEGTPWTIPLRLREDLRGWFHVIDLDEATGAEVFGGEIMPEALAGGVLRLPVTSRTDFPGLRVAAKVVPLGSVLATGSGAGSGAGVRVGVATGLRREPLDVVLDDEAMSRHVQVIGETGSGKSTVLTAAAIEIARDGGGLLLLDPHGTTVDRILAELPPAARERVLLVRCGDSKNPVRLNPFAISDPELQDIVISDMLEAFQRLYDPRHEGMAGPRFQHVMRHSLLTLVAARGQRASLLDVARLLYDHDLRRHARRFVQDPDLERFWVNDFDLNRSNDTQEVSAWIGSKFSSFASNRAVQAMLSTGADSFDPAQAMADNRIVLVDLNKGTVGNMGARTIGLLYLLRFWVAALNREQPDPFTVLVDEAASFSSVALPAILSEGRKFGLRAMIAHQFMDQLDPVLKEAIEGSVGTRLVFRVGVDDARSLSATLHPEFRPSDLLALPQFVAAMRMADSGRPIRPFTLTVDHNQRVARQPDAADAIAEMTAASIRELVDPHRDAERFEVSSDPGSGRGAGGDGGRESANLARELGIELSSRDSARTGGPAADRGAGGSTSFLDDWLANRRSRDSRRSGSGTVQSDSGTASNRSSHDGDRVADQRRAALARVRSVLVALRDQLSDTDEAEQR